MMGELQILLEKPFVLPFDAVPLLIMVSAALVAFAVKS